MEALLGIITACLPMARPVASRCWKSLPLSARSRVLTVSATMGSVVAWLSLPSLGLGSRSWDWFSAGREEGEGQSKALGGSSVGSEKGEGKDASCGASDGVVESLYGRYR